MKHLFLILSIGFVLAACNSNSDTAKNQSDTSDHATHNTNDDAAGGQNHMKTMHDAMSNMEQQMKTMKPTGDVDYDFAMMMKHHHQSSIEMARAEIDGGTDVEMKQIAQKLLDEQSNENRQFDQFMQGKQPSGNSDYGQKAMGMMTPMSNIKMESSSLDAMFASMMIPHHEDAVKMAREYLKVGKDEALKKLAKSITETQPKEVEQFKNWLNRNKS